MNDFERELRNSLAENARHAPSGDGLAERIIAEAWRSVPEQRSRRSRWRAWLLPAIAAACVAGLVAAIVVVASLQRPKTHSANTPSYPPTPRSTGAPASSTAAQTTMAPLSRATSSALTSTTPAAGSIPKGFRVADLTFVGTQQGWAIGGKCATDPSQGCSALLSTPDGGEHWDSVGSLPPGVEHIRFANDLTGYAYGPNALYMTTDGGANWGHRQSGGADALETLSGNVIRVTDQGNCPPGCSYQVLTAPVGSEQWQKAQLPGSTSGDSVLLSRTGDAAYLLIQQHPAGGAGSQQPTLLASPDNGRTWNKLNTPCPQDSGEVDASLMTTADDGSVTLLCTPRGGSGSQFTVTSTNGGTGFATGPRGALGKNVVWALGAASASVLLVSADDTYRSPDGGKSWHRLGAGRPGQLSWIGFENASVGRAISRDGHTIWTTYDAGQSWTPHTFQ